MYAFWWNEFEACEYDLDKGAVCAAHFPPFQLYSSLEKGQVYIFRVGSGQVNSLPLVLLISRIYLHGNYCSYLKNISFEVKMFDNSLKD